MAGRKEQNNVSYFPFYCKYGDAMVYMENKYGNDGFAVWVKILRELAVKNYHYLDLKTHNSKMLLASKCKISVELLIQIIEDLVEFEEINRMVWEKYSVIWNQKFITSIEDAYRKRSNKTLSLNQLVNVLTGEKEQSGGVNEDKGVRNTQTKENKIKQKKTILNNENSDKSFFRIGKELFKEKPSEYLKREHGIFVEQWVMKQELQILAPVFEKLDNEYNCYTFSNINHIQNAFKKVWENYGKSKSTANNTRNERLNSVGQMEDLAVAILQGGQINHDKGSH